MWMYMENDELESKSKGGRWNKLIRLSIGQHFVAFQKQIFGRFEGQEDLKWDYFFHVEQNFTVRGLEVGGAQSTCSHQITSLENSRSTQTIGLYKGLLSLPASKDLLACKLIWQRIESHQIQLIGSSRFE